MRVRVAEDGLREYCRPSPADLSGVLEATASAHPRKRAMIDDHGVVDYATFSARVAATAAGLAERGVGPGDRVAILLHNGIPFTCALWAAWRLGAIAVPLNHRLRAVDLVPLVHHAAPALLLGGGDLAAMADEVAAATGVALADPNHLATSTRAVPAATAIDSSASAAIVFTSGTSGRPKGVLVSHRNLIQASLTCQEVVGRRPDDVELVCVPQFNITGLAAQTVPAVHAGMTAVLIRRFDPADVLAAIARDRVTVMVAAPTMWWRILAHPAFGHADVSSLRLVLTGGAPLPAALLERLRQAFPDASIGNGYGMTETCSMVTYVGGEDLLLRPDTVGPALPITDVRVVDPATGEDVPRGAAGELWFRGPQLALGYWRDPAASAELLVAGWLRTGDIGVIDERGNVALRDRLKDVIKRAGESVYCVEIEEVLSRHPDVLEAAVVGLPDLELGERVAALVVLGHEHATTEEGIRNFCAEHLARFKVPSVVAIAEELPRNASGKVLRQDVRRRLTGEESTTETEVAT